MASDGEVESFEITDYDLESELNPGMRRKQTKEEAIYGIWATSDDENEDNFRKKSKKKMKNDYTQPLGFVSGGLFHDEDKQSGAETPEDVEGKSGDDQNDEGEGVYGSKNFVKSKKTKTLKQETFREQDSKKKFKKHSKQFGAWEKYSSGFASKMLEKMGYTGKGLGKKGEGIVEPITAHKRSGRGAIGAYGSEGGPRRDMKPVVDSDDDGDEDEDEAEKDDRENETLHQWKKGGEEDAHKKPKYVYKTADEVRKSRSSKNKLAPLLVTHSNVKVVDMTGPQTKVLQGYGALGLQHAKPDEPGKHPGVQSSDENFDIPELVYNLNLLVDLAESDILQIDRQLQHEKDNVINYTHEYERLEKETAVEEIEIENLEHVLKIIQRCKEGLQPDNDEQMTLEGLIVCFRKLQDDYHEEYKLYGLENLVVPLGYPLITRHFAAWQPFDDPTYGIEVVKLWQQLLEEKTKDELTLEYTENRSMNQYERLIWDLWMPHIRTTIIQWLPKDCDKLVAIMEAWVNLLPDWVVANILDQLVLPKLMAAVEAWNPLTDFTPIHSWLHPWLPLMGEKMEPLYAPIRQKFASALKNWYPSDPSAKVILSPWIKVFSKGMMEAFLLCSIFPKLEQCMIEFKINPHQQLLEPFHWVMGWKDIISVHHMVSILDKHFFPKWLQVLRKWLSSQPNYDEVTQWYLGWKSMFTEGYASNPTIKEHFSRALNLMNEAVTGAFQPGAKENVAFLTNTERRREAEQAALKSDKGHIAVTNTSVPSCFKDLVEKAAEDHGLLFIPMPNRRHEGKTVYSFGKCLIYIDRDVIFYSKEGKWLPSSIQELLPFAV